MKESEAKFMALDWDGGEYRLLPSNDVIEAIYIAWNYEFDVYEVETEEIIFSGREDNDTNSEWLEPYGIRMVDHNGRRELQEIKTGKTHNFWDYV